MLGGERVVNKEKLKGFSQRVLSTLGKASGLVSTEGQVASGWVIGDSPSHREKAAGGTGTKSLSPSGFGVFQGTGGLEWPGGSEQSQGGGSHGQRGRTRGRVTKGNGEKGLGGTGSL